MDDKNLTSRRCCCCATEFQSEAEYRNRTRFAGFLYTGSYAEFNLELRNCDKCGSTISTVIPKCQEEDTDCVPLKRR